MSTFPILVASVTLAQGQPPVDRMVRIFAELIEIAGPTNIESIRPKLQSASPRVTSWTGRNGRLWWEYGLGLATVHFTNRGEFRGFTTPFAPKALRHRPDGELLSEASQVVDTIGFWGESRSMRIQRNEDHGAKVVVDAHFGDMTATHNASIQYADKSQALESVFMWDRLDYSRFRNAQRVSRMAALQAARDAYLSFNPFPVTAIGEVRPFFGIPASAEVDPPTWHEISPAEFEVFRSYVAMPLYYVDFTNASGEPHPITSRVTVVVNAMSGRAIVLYPQSGRSAHAPPLRKPPTLGSSVRITQMDGRFGTADRRATSSKELREQIGRPVAFRIGELLYAARYEASTAILHLPNGKGSVSYRATSDLAGDLAKRTFPSKPFGGGPNKPVTLPSRSQG